LAEFLSLRPTNRVCAQAHFLSLSCGLENPSLAAMWVPLAEASSLLLRNGLGHAMAAGLFGSRPRACTRTPTCSPRVLFRRHVGPGLAGPSSTAKIDRSLQRTTRRIRDCYGQLTYGTAANLARFSGLDSACPRAPYYINPALAPAHHRITARRSRRRVPPQAIFGQRHCRAFRWGLGTGPRPQDEVYGRTERGWLVSTREWLIGARFRHGSTPHHGRPPPDANPR
jgi:hypothetical protein